MRRRSLLAAVLCFAVPASASPGPQIAAASSLRYALDEAASAFASDTGDSVRITYAASGNLVQQIEAGAPYQLFLSADESHVFRLAERRIAPDRGQVYALGRLALIAPARPAFQLDPRLVGLGAAIGSGRIRRLAIANPQTAPYGAAARDALTASRLWPSASRLLATGENVGQVLQFVISGNAEAGLVSLSLAKNPAFKGRYAVVDAALHKPLVQRLVLLPGAGPTARRFHGWLLSPRGQAVLSRHGYGPPPWVQR